jgi:restriction endonuclease S subunit
VERTEVQGRWPTPGHWKWYALSDVLNVDPRTGKRIVQGDPPAKKELVNDAGTVPMILSGNLRDTREVHTNNRILQKDVDSRNLRMWDKRVLLVAAARENMGRVGIFAGGQSMTINNVVHVLDPDKDVMLLDFLFYYFLLDKTRKYLREELAPGKKTYISPEELGEAAVVTPPLREQQRIVDRIEALIYDFDRCLSLLEEQRDDMDAVMELLTRQSGSAARLDAAQETLRKMREKQDEEWQRVQGMRQQILEKAFRGML